MSSKIIKKENEITLKTIDVLLSKLHVMCPEDLYSNILNNSPKPYPSSTRIIKLNSKAHILYGRRFGTSMLCYNVKNCDYCGKICNNHDENLLEKNYVIYRSHLSKKILCLEILL